MISHSHIVDIGSGITWWGFNDRISLRGHWMFEFDSVDVIFNIRYSNYRIPLWPAVNAYDMLLVRWKSNQFWIDQSTFSCRVFFESFWSYISDTNQKGWKINPHLWISIIFNSNFEGTLGYTLFTATNSLPSIVVLRFPNTCCSQTMRK